MSQTVDEIHAASKIVEIDLTKLKVDPSYQRDFSEERVDKYANNWDQIAAELITVSDRGPRTNDPNGVEGGLWVVNGQHRSKAAAKKGLKTIWARVIDLKKEEDPAAIEARLRLTLNDKLSDRPLERFKAQLRAGDEQSVAITKIMERFDTQINFVPNKETGVDCISTVEAIYRMDDGSTLTDAMEVIRDVFGHVGGRNMNSNPLKAVVWFIEKHAEESDRDRLVTKMKQMGQNVWESRARSMSLTMGGALWVNYYRALVDTYNEQLREKSRLHYKTRGKNALARGGGGNRDSNS